MGVGGASPRHGPVAGDAVAIFHDDLRLVTHERGAQGQRRTIESHLPEHRRELRHRARAACARSRFYANYKYGAIKNILRKGLDLEPLPDVVLPDRGGWRNRDSPATSRNCCNGWRRTMNSTEDLPRGRGRAPTCPRPGQ